MLIFLGWKSGWFRGQGDGGNDSEQQTTQFEERVETTSSEASDQEIDITVTGDKIVYNGTTVSSEDLREKIQNWAPNATVNLTDDAAIKATYEDVLSILTEAGVTIKETTK